MQSVAIALPTEKTVDERVPPPGPGAARRPSILAQISTTGRPPAVTDTAAPSSPRSAKLAASASRTAPKRSSQKPSIEGMDTC